MMLVEIIVGNVCIHDSVFLIVMLGV